MKVKNYTAENLKNIMNDADFAEWLALEAKGKRLGSILNSTSGNYARDAARGAQKLNRRKRQILRKYGIMAN